MNSFLGGLARIEIEDRSKSVLRNVIKSQIKASRVALQSQEPFIKGINRRGVIFHVLLNLLNLAIDVVNFAIYFFKFFGKRILFFFLDSR